MAVTYVTGVKTSRMTAVRDAIDAGSGAGYLEIGHATGGAGTTITTVYATVTFDDPSGTISGAQLLFSGFPKTVTASSGHATNVANSGRIRTSAAADVVTGLTVGTSGTDIILDSTTITAGNSITINATPSITHAT